MTKKTASDAARFAAAVAAHRSWEVNTDTALVVPVLEGLAANFNSYGYYQCPCRDSWGSREKDQDIVCPCRYAAADIEDYGQCYCGLYVSADFLQKGREACTIPERRPEDLYP